MNPNKLSVQTKIELNRFHPREYQLPICDALENKGYRRILYIAPRRSGKDVVSWNLLIRAAIKRIAVYYYVFPTYSQARKVIWQSVTNSGMRFLDYIPRELIQSENSSEMRVLLKNGSSIQLLGSDNVDSIVGTNPYGIVFSEYALQDPRAYQYLRPILLANGGWALFESTPRGKNHLWDLYNIAKESDDWFCYKIGLDETQHIPLHEIEKERAEGLISEDLIQQEYYCSFEMGVEGSYYLKYLDKMRISGQIGIVPWESAFKVHLSIDIGVRDSTTIIWFQTIGQTVRIIDCYENSKQGLEFYVNIINSKPYSLGRCFAPHDIAVKEWGSGLTRIEKAKQLGITFTTAPNLEIEDGIEAVRSAFSKIWIDETKCKSLLKALENYRQEWDHKKKVYKGIPLHDWSSHFCFTADTLVLTRHGTHPIINIKKNDEVLTLKGWKKCVHSGMTQRNAQLVEVIFQDNTKVRCTPDHLFLTETGWISAKNLQKNTKIQSSLMQQPNILMESCIEYIQEKNIFPRVQEDCIKMRGEKPSVKYPKIVTYITKTVLYPITVFKILNVYLGLFISKCRDQIIKVLARKPEMRQQNGINQKLAGYGIVDMQNESNHGQHGSESLETVFIAQKNLVASSEKMVTRKNSVIPTAKHLLIESVNYLTKTEDVYDLEIEDVHHFSLSNGAIVHNSDAMRYLCLSLNKTRDGLSPEDLERRYQEAMHGDTARMPAPFREPY